MNSIVEPTQILDLVRKHVEPHQPDNYRLRVSETGLRQEDDWWYVLVQPDRNGVRAHDYADRLTQIEDEIFAKEGVHVLLVPVLVDD